MPDLSKLNSHCHVKDIPHAADLGQACNQRPTNALIWQISKSTTSGLRGKGTTGNPLGCSEICPLVGIREGLRLFCPDPVAARKRAHMNPLGALHRRRIKGHSLASTSVWRDVTLCGQDLPEDRSVSRDSLDNGLYSLRLGTSTGVWFGNHLGFDASRGRM